MSTLESIITSGNRPPLDPDLKNAGIGIKLGENQIACIDGFTVSVIAGDGTYCTPRPSSFNLPHIGQVAGDYRGPFFEVEVGYPSERPEPWISWQTYADGEHDPTESVYGYVPVCLVRDLIAAHGGEAS